MEAAPSTPATGPALESQIGDASISRRSYPADGGSGISIQDSIAAFKTAMEAGGVRTKDKIRADGELHRCHVDGQRKGSKNGWYILHLDQRPAGAFGDWSTQQHVTWVAEGASPLSPEERKAFRAKIEADREQRREEQRIAHEEAANRAQALWDAATEAPADHSYLARKGVQAYGIRSCTWPVDYHDAETGEVKFSARIPNALLVPLSEITAEGKAKLVSLQAIFPDKKNKLGRDKDFLAGGKKEACFYVIGKPVEIDGARTFIIVEGYATGASVHQATGIGVIVAFDAGNLMPVAKAWRARFPDMRFILAADNDQWTVRPIKNPGFLRARQAVAEIGQPAAVALPQFVNVETKPTDFNDLAQLEGGDKVKATIMVAIHPAPPAPPEPAAAPEAPVDAAAATPTTPAAPGPVTVLEPAAAGGDGEVYDHVREAADDSSGGFTILGYDHGEFFLHHHAKKQIIKVTARTFSSDYSILEIAELQWWQLNFPGPKGAIDKVAACNWFIKTAHHRGVYDPTKVRGRGAWRDEKQHVVHFGDALSVDGKRTEVHKIESEFIYELRAKLPAPADTPLSDADGQIILDVAMRFRWKNPSSALLLAGWVALAPICGALRWRPHIWLTGPAGCGKSTILRDFAVHLTGGMSLHAQGATTEAGIRQELGYDALPVLYDEAESNDERDVSRLQNVLALARQSSTETGALTLKGTTQGSGMRFLTRSMFALSSIQVGIRQQADHDRIAKLDLRKKGDPDVEDYWPATKAAILRMHSDRGLASRLIRRTLNNLPMILENVEIFAEIAANRLGAQREGDQYGTLLAGAWSLTHSRPVTRGEAEKFIDQYDWGVYLEETRTEESEKALSVLLAAKIDAEQGKRPTVGELIDDAMRNGKDSHASLILRRNGIKVSKDKLLLATGSLHIKRLFEGTSFMEGWKDQILRTKGAAIQVYDNGHHKGEKFAPGGKAESCIFVPLSEIFDEETAAANDELPL